MSREIDVERALKDEAYFNSLTSEEQALLRNPAGDASLTEKELDSVAGGRPRMSTDPDCYNTRTKIMRCM